MSPGATKTAAGAVAVGKYVSLRGKNIVRKKKKKKTFFSSFFLSNYLCPDNCAAEAILLRRRTGTEKLITFRRACNYHAAKSETRRCYSNRTYKTQLIHVSDMSLNQVISDLIEYTPARRCRFFIFFP